MEENIILGQNIVRNKGTNKTNSQLNNEHHMNDDIQTVFSRARVEGRFGEGDRGGGKDSNALKVLHNYMLFPAMHKSVNPVIENPYGK